jgi:hypothetical protein
MIKTHMRYRVIAITVHQHGVADADRLANILKDEGWPRATRSLVVREALECLSAQLRDKTPEEIFRFFVERRAKRATGTSAGSSDFSAHS